MISVSKNSDLTALEKSFDIVETIDQDNVAKMDCKCKELKLQCEEQILFTQIDSEKPLPKLFFINICKPVSGKVLNKQSNCSAYCPIEIHVDNHRYILCSSINHPTCHYTCNFLWDGKYFHADDDDVTESEDEVTNNIANEKAVFLIYVKQEEIFSSNSEHAKGIISSLLGLDIDTSTFCSAIKRSKRRLSKELDITSLSLCTRQVKQKTVDYPSSPYSSDDDSSRSNKSDSQTNSDRNDKSSSESDVEEVNTQRVGNRIIFQNPSKRGGKQPARISQHEKDELIKVFNDKFHSKLEGLRKIPLIYSNVDAKKKDKILTDFKIGYIKIMQCCGNLNSDGKNHQQLMLLGSNSRLYSPLRLFNYRCQLHQKHKLQMAYNYLRNFFFHPDGQPKFKKKKSETGTKWEIDNVQVCDECIYFFLSVSNGTFNAAKNKCFSDLTKGVIPSFTHKNSLIQRSSSGKLYKVKDAIQRILDSIGETLPTGEGVLPAFTLDELKVLLFEYTEGLDFSDTTVRNALNSDFDDIKVRLCKYKSFGRCAVCLTLRDLIKKFRSKKDPSVSDIESNKQIEELLQAHYAHFTLARGKSTKHLKKATESMENYKQKPRLVLHIDGMDQAKTTIPRKPVESKKLQDCQDKITCHCSGVLAYGSPYPAQLYVTDPSLPNDPNLTITVHHNALVKHYEGIKRINEEIDQGIRKQNKLRIPEILEIQSDNATRDNKSQYVFYYFGLLVGLGFFRKVKLNFGIVGHTHDRIDQMFRALAERLRHKEIETMQDLIQHLSTAYTFHVDLNNINQSKPTSINNINNNSNDNNNNRNDDRLSVVDDVEVDCDLTQLSDSNESNITELDQSNSLSSVVPVSQIDQSSNTNSRKHSKRNHHRTRKVADNVINPKLQIEQVKTVVAFKQFIEQFRQELQIPNFQGYKDSQQHKLELDNDGNVVWYAKSMCCEADPRVYITDENNQRIKNEFIHESSGRKFGYKQSYKYWPSKRVLFTRHQIQLITSATYKNQLYILPRLPVRTEALLSLLHDNKILTKETSWDLWEQYKNEQHQVYNNLIKCDGCKIILKKFKLNDGIIEENKSEENSNSESDEKKSESDEKKSESDEKKYNIKYHGTANMTLTAHLSDRNDTTKCKNFVNVFQNLFDPPFIKWNIHEELKSVEIQDQKLDNTIQNENIDRYTTDPSAWQHSFLSRVPKQRYNPETKRREDVRTSIRPPEYLLSSSHDTDKIRKEAVIIFIITIHDSNSLCVYIIELYNYLYYF